MASSEALQLAAQAWCEKETELLIMQPELAEAFANILDRVIEGIHNGVSPSLSNFLESPKKKCCGGKCGCKQE